MENTNELIEIVTDGFSLQEVKESTEVMDFAKLTEISTMLSKSTIVPINYQNRPENCFVALDMAQRTGMSPFTVMQNLHVIQGKPSWSGQAVSAMIRNSRQFTNVQLHYVGEPTSDSYGAYVTATRSSNGELIKGGLITIAVSKKEGWYQKNGSKWQTMPDLMLAYRAYAWFGRVYAPELLMGFQSAEEVEDTIKPTSNQDLDVLAKGGE